MRATVITFASLDRAKGIEDSGSSDADDFPLAAWYKSLRDTPLDQLSIEDICKAVRQHIHVEHVTPVALSVLAADVFAGELYEGELLVALKGVPAEYWCEHEPEKQQLLSAARRVLNSEATTPDVRQDIDEMVRRL